MLTPSRPCTKPNGQKSWRWLHSPHSDAFLSEPVLLWALGKESLLAYLHLGADVFIVCVLCCVCLDVEPLCLSPFHPLQPAEFLEQQPLKARLVFRLQSVAGRDGEDGLGMLQALGGSRNITAVWEGRQGEEVAPDRVCPGEQGELAMLFPSEQLVHKSC